MKRHAIRYLLGLSALVVLSLSACNKDKEYIFEVDEVDLYQSATEKNRLKSETEFIAIAYSDLFGTSINSGQMDKLIQAYLAFGDKVIIQDFITRNFLNEPSANIPSDATMRADMPAYVDEVYTRFYNRKPTEFELWQMEKLISEDAGMTSELVIYAIMTSEEYRYY